MVENLLALNILFSFLAGVIGFVIYNRNSAFIWGYLAYILPEFPKILRVFNISNIYTLALFSHTAGIFLWPLLLVLVNGLLISLGIIRVASPFTSFLPKWLRQAIFVERFTDMLQKYNIIPRPLRIKDVYIIGMIGGSLNLMFWMFTGYL